MSIQADVSAVILAAGKGTRMKSNMPKVMHCLLGKPLIAHVMAMLERAGIRPDCQVIVVGHGGGIVKSYVSVSGARLVFQEQQLGTGHAVICTREAFSGFHGNMLVVCGDSPLFHSKTIQRFVMAHQQYNAVVSVLTAELKDPAGYGRIIRNESGDVEGIVEEKDASVHQKEIGEINTGVYCLNSPEVFGLLQKLGCDNAQGEYYLTDVVGIALRAGMPVHAFGYADEEESLGVNSRYQLALAEHVLLKRIRQRHMDAGVTISMPDTIYIEPEVEIGSDVTIGPHSVLRGQTVIGESSVIGAFSFLEDFICEPGSVIAPFTRHCQSKEKRIFCP